MHVRHESLLRWLVARFPRTRLYGPYHHGERSYFQWMARGPRAGRGRAAGARAARRRGARRPCGGAAGRDARALRGATSRARARGGDVTATVARRLAQLAARFGLPDAARRQLRALCSRSSRPIRRAPTAVRDPAQAVDVHVADALVALELDAVRSARRIADLGAGRGLSRAGAGGRAARARGRASSRASGRKCAFIERAVAAMGLAQRRGRRARARRRGRRDRDAATS